MKEWTSAAGVTRIQAVSCIWGCGSQRSPPVRDWKPLSKPAKVRSTSWYFGQVKQENSSCQASQVHCSCGTGHPVCSLPFERHLQGSACWKGLPRYDCVFLPPGMYTAPLFIQSQKVISGQAPSRLRGRSSVLAVPRKRWRHKRV